MTTLTRTRTQVVRGRMLARSSARVGQGTVSPTGGKLLGLALTNTGLTLAGAVAGYYFFGIIGAIAGAVLVVTAGFWIPIVFGFGGVGDA